MFMEQFLYISKAIAILFEHESFVACEWQACSQEEIQALADLLPSGCELPASIREFLTFCGKGVLKSTPMECFFYPCLLSHQREYHDTNMRKSFAWPAQLPSDALVIGVNYNTDIYYVRLTEGPNPPVHFAESPDEEHFVTFRAFSNLIEHFFSSVSNYHRGLIHGRVALQRLTNDFKVEFFNLHAELESIGKAYKLETQTPFSTLMWVYRELRQDFYEIIYRKLPSGAVAANLDRSHLIAALGLPHELDSTLREKMVSLQSKWIAVVREGKILDKSGT